MTQPEAAQAAVALLTACTGNLDSPDLGAATDDLLSDLVPAPHGAAPALHAMIGTLAFAFASLARRYGLQDELPGFLQELALDVHGAWSPPDTGPHGHAAAR